MREKIRIYFENTSSIKKEWLYSWHSTPRNRCQHWRGKTKRGYKCCYHYTNSRTNTFRSSNSTSEILLANSVLVNGFYVWRGKPNDVFSFLRQLVLAFFRLLPSNCVCTIESCFNASLRCILQTAWWDRVWNTIRVTLVVKSDILSGYIICFYWLCDRFIQKEDMINRAI